jgi:hypothetical protein
MVESFSIRERELLDAISQAQSVENAAAARKASAIREFALARAAALTAVGDVEPERVERKIVAEVAVACRMSPFQGRRRLHAARDLHLGLDARWRRSSGPATATGASNSIATRRYDTSTTSSAGSMVAARSS